VDNAATGVAADKRRADRRHALSQDFRILTQQREPQRATRDPGHPVLRFRAASTLPPRESGLLLMSLSAYAGTRLRPVPTMARQIGLFCINQLMKALASATTHSGGYRARHLPFTTVRDAILGTAGTPQ
jgi:hypothetical protein